MEGTPKTVTVSKEADGWYVANSCADVPVHPLPATGQETGIDLVLESFATLADGAKICAPGYYRKAEAYLRRCQRRVARRPSQEGQPPTTQGSGIAHQSAALHRPPAARLPP